jgi:hypothetical protein
MRYLRKQCDRTVKEEEKLSGKATGDRESKQYGQQEHKWS